MTKIPVMEIFGPTIQGEGMVIGQKTMFVRTAGCDYSCAWCDSSFTWDGSGKDLVRQMDADEVWRELKALGGDGFTYVTISGGNPALIKNLSGLVELLKENQISICLETQGSKWQDWFLEIDALTLSPKPPSSGMETDFEVLDQIVECLKENGSIKNASLKIVVFDAVDYEFAKLVHQRYPDLAFFLQVGNDDLATEDQVNLMSSLVDKYEWLINKVMCDVEMNNVRVLPQLHVYVWGNKRGV